MTHRAGTLGLVHTHGWAAKGIEWAQHDYWNHVVVAKGDGQCYSAEPGSGVRLRREDEWSDVAWLTNEPMKPLEGADRMIYCELSLGTPYNWWAILAFSRWWLPLPKWFIRWTANRKAVICSELAVQAMRHGGKDIFPDHLAATVAPAGIDIEFRRRGW